MFTAPYKLVYKSEALLEITEAAQWYLNVSLQVFINFKLALAQSEEELITNPFAFSTTKHKKFRRKIIKGFPHKMIYFIDTPNTEIVIFTFFHTARSNKFIVRRLKDN